MEQGDLVERLRHLVNKRVRFTFTDGEALVGDLSLVLEDERAVVFDLVTSNMPDKYEKSDRPPHIFAKLDDVVSCEAAEG